MAKRRVAPGVYERSRGVYELVVSRGKDERGRHRQRSRTFRGTLAEAKKARARLLAEAQADPAKAAGSEPSVMIFRELLHRHIERVGTMGASAHTVIDYRGMARNHLEPVFGEIPTTSSGRSTSTRSTTT